MWSKQLLLEAAQPHGEVKFTVNTVEGYAYRGISGWNLYFLGMCQVGDSDEDAVVSWLNRFGAEWEEPDDE